MARGDLVSILYYWGIVPYRHFGIDIGDGTVVHLATRPDSSAMQVQRVDWDAFSNGKPVRIESVPSTIEPEEVVRRAIAAVGDEGYHVALGNCEHFARACKSGKFVSHQSERVLRGVFRTGMAGALSCSARMASMAASGGIPRAILSKSAGASSLIGELARQVAYAASRNAAIDHKHADDIGRTAGTMAAAIAGTVISGPVGGAASAALYLSIDRITCAAANKVTSKATVFAGPAPCRTGNDSASGTDGYRTKNRTHPPT